MQEFGSWKEKQLSIVALKNSQYFFVNTQLQFFSCSGMSEVNEVTLCYLIVSVKCTFICFLVNSPYCLVGEIIFLL